MCVLLVQVYGAVIFRFVNIKEELRSQILQHAIFQHLKKKCQGGVDERRITVTVNGEAALEQ